MEVNFRAGSFAAEATPDGKVRMAFWDENTLVSLADETTPPWEAAAPAWMDILDVDMAEMIAAAFELDARDAIPDDVGITFSYDNVTIVIKMASIEANLTAESIREAAAEARAK